MNNSKMELQAAIRIGERYWMATLLLIFIITVSGAVIVNRQMEVNNCWRSHNESRNRIENLVELRGQIQEKNNNSLILKQQTDIFLNRTFSNEDRAIKNVEDCEKRLRDIETSTRQLIVNVTTLANEKDKLAVKYNKCSDQLTALERTKTSQN